MKPIVTLTVNPSVDESTSVCHVVADRKLRCEEPIYESGGGGINVSRVIKILGGETRAMYLAGGATGRFFQQLIEKTGVELHPMPIDGLTRTDLIITEDSTGRQYRFGMPGPSVKEAEWKRCLTELENLDCQPDYIVASGSLPPGIPEEFYHMVAYISRRLDAKYIVDTSGPALASVSKGEVFLLKPNMSELRTLAGRELKNEAEIESAVADLIRKGKSQIIVVSLGASGALVATKTGIERIPAPVVPIVSRVGAGDSMVAGIVLGLARGMSVLSAVRFGVAAGSATVMTPGTNLCRREDVERLYAAISDSPAE
jgi:6-phosphofructokinase 2